MLFIIKILQIIDYLKTSEKQSFYNKFKNNPYKKTLLSFLDTAL